MWKPEWSARAKYIVAFALATVASGQAEGLAQERAPQTQRVVYKPPDVGAPPTRTLAAARGPGQQPAVHVLAPEQTGLTLKNQPQLVWYLGEPSGVDIEFTLIDERAVEPLLEINLGQVEEPGYHIIDLKDHGVRLDPGREYRWSVAQVIDRKQRSADVVASATLAVQPDANLAEQFPGMLREGLPPADATARLQILADRGYWYDLIAGLSAQISFDPTDRRLRELRARLLHDVGLRELATNGQ
jgi:Domain of Unknown Function (DUF928)